MKTLIRRKIEKAVTAVKTDEQQKSYEHRRFIPDARPITSCADRGAFGSQIRLQLRVARLKPS